MVVAVRRRRNFQGELREEVQFGRDDTKGMKLQRRNIATKSAQRYVSSNWIFTMLYRLELH